MAKKFVLRFNVGGKCMLCGQGHLENPDKRMMSLIDPSTCHIVMIICNNCIDEKFAERFEDDLLNDIIL